MPDKIMPLDHYVDSSMDFFEQAGDYTLELPPSSHTLVVGSQNGWLTGRVLYRFAGRAFSHAAEVLAQDEIDAKKEQFGDVTIVSATGSRNVLPIAKYALDKGLDVNAVVCLPNSALMKTFGGNIHEILVPATEEPATINTSTYGRMIQGVTHEDVGRIRGVVRSLEGSEGFYDEFEQFTLLLPDSMPEVAAMADWKFNEIFGRRRGSRAMYWTNAMHGAGINDDPKEAYVSIGVENPCFGRPGRRQHITVPDDFGPLGYMLISYSVIGRMQKAKKDRGFQDNIMDYKVRSGKWDWKSPISGA